MRLLFALLLSATALAGQSPAEMARWKATAERVTIIRDRWGIPHIYGKTDADVVFGLLYAQCEDDFFRVEQNYIEAIGRLAEVEGESALFHDIRARLFLDTAQAAAIYAGSPAWMKKLLDAFADGMNYYLYTHPQVRPKLLTRFQPWMPLTFSEGSIGGNISEVSLGGIKRFYGPTLGSATGFVEDEELPEWEREPTGSNGFAIAPSKSASGNALLLINPHTSFYFRSEVHMVSEEGLNAYGAVTWGQFFIYQGFNEYCGWMHTSSQADPLDEYLETVEFKGDRLTYRYGGKQLPVQQKEVLQAYRDGGDIRQKQVVLYWTHHGPVIDQRGDQWVSMKMMNQPLEALSQSYLRTKARGYASYQKVMRYRTNSSNNTVFADRDGNIAYWHGNFMPRRNPAFDWEKPVDGSNPETEWKGLHQVNEPVQFRNPASGWIQNCNATPFTAAGPSSPRREDYPVYMAPDPENFRGLNAVRVLSGQKWPISLDQLIEAGYDPYLSAFERLIPALLKAYDERAVQNDPVAAALQEPIALLRDWKYDCGVASIPTTLAVFWGEKLIAFTRVRMSEDMPGDQISIVNYMIGLTTTHEKLQVLQETIQKLTEDFGTWKVAWGHVNRFQRLTGKVQESYDDQKPSTAIGFTGSLWGSLPAFGARNAPNTKKRYGYVGNSFVAAVEFGPRIRAKSIVTGGSSADPASPHFSDQVEGYAKHQFKDVLFYPEEVRKQAERTYHPGQ
ncbi:MAG: penicillin acylase family protein [Haliscomenobacter sp.]